MTDRLSLFEEAAEKAAFADPNLARSQALAELLGAPKTALPPADGLFTPADPIDAAAADPIDADPIDGAIDDAIDEHAGTSRVAHCATCERYLRAATRRNRNRQKS